MNLIEFAKKIRPGYVPDWFHELIAHWLEQTLEPEGPNLLISAPPGHGKTEEVSILFPAYVLSLYPEKHIISLANSDGLASMASSSVLRLAQSPAFQEIRPLTLDKATEKEWTINGNDGRPSLRAAGIMGQLTGHRADYLIFDDLLKSQQDAYSEVIRERVWANFSSAAETRLLPDGKIIGIMTRWHLDDPMGRLLRRAQEDKLARQFVYLSLAAWNTGEDSFILNTATGEKQELPRYRQLASVPKQKYSFSRKLLEGKKADLGPARWSALYMQQPLTTEDQLFPENVWKSLDAIATDQISLIITAWDCASKTGAKNDYSANVVIGRLNSGGFVVLDVWKSRLNFAQLPKIVMERYKFLMDRFHTLPVLCIEDANSGTQLIDLFQDSFPEIPLIRAKAVHAKIIRAEGITPYTSAGLVWLPKEAEWRDGFVRELANFPVGEHDDIVDAFCHALKGFTTERAFHSPEMRVLPGPVPDPYEEEIQERLEEQEYKKDCGDLSSWDNNLIGGKW
jgi:predicted phage terminase large subunit-like protein